VEAGTRVVQLAYSNGDADDVVDQAQAEVYAVTERRISEDYLPLSEIMEGTLDEIDAINFAAASSPASPPASPTWTNSPTAYTPASS
jgi:replicative DNA helicase